MFTGTTVVNILLRKNLKYFTLILLLNIVTLTYSYNNNFNIDMPCLFTPNKSNSIFNRIAL